ncbi:MAG TPA: lipocalin-like domain-containing protein [Desulfomonilaceae bacterium]|nr:lipocalin-like domain-containing protein [Desulfomonilaceae bacterium]
MYLTMALLICLWISQTNLGVAADQGFQNALPGRNLVFPKDHGQHPDFQTEWWYFTGNVDSPGDSGAWGFQLTFFRRSMGAGINRGASAWAVRDVYPAHFAMSDITNKDFFHSQLISRAGPGLASSATDKLDVKIRDWKATMDGNTIQISAREGDYAFSFRLLSEKPLVLHGMAGFSRKSDAENQASYYYSFTRLKAEGTLTFKGTTHTVSGLAWMDHEFGSSVVLPSQSGWDWFSVQFDDGTELMVSRMRRKSGEAEKPFGTFVNKDGSIVDLEKQEIVISARNTWTSPHTGARYPSGWTLEIPSLNVELQIEPALKDQELAGGESFGVVYWEGAVAVTGMRNGRPVQGRGYVELTGYAGSLGGLL